MFYFVFARRVHISRATLDCLGGTYQTEVGHGQDRSEFLRKHNIDTYLVHPVLKQEAELPKERRPSYDDVTTWSAELPFGDILGMNFVKEPLQRHGGHFNTGLDHGILVLFLDPCDLHQRFVNPAAQSHRIAVLGPARGQQTHPSGHRGQEQRANQEGAHHDLHSGVQGHQYGGEGNRVTLSGGYGCIWWRFNCLFLPSFSSSILK